MDQVGLNDWLRRFFQPKPSVPDGWTDEMSVQLPRGHTVEELVDYILAANQQGRPHETLIAELTTEFGLSNEDAELSVDEFSAREHETITNGQHTIYRSQDRTPLTDMC